MNETHPARPPGPTPCSVFELRQYTLRPGRRDALIDLFDREFVETQEAVGMRVVGQFRDAGDPDRFVWIRGFRDMASRAAALAAFYGGPVWKAHREEANATMLDSSNVLLLRPVSPSHGFTLSDVERPPPGASALPASLVVAAIHPLEGPAGGALPSALGSDVLPALAAAGARPLATFRTEPAPNDFPRLPVREGENVFVWFAAFGDAAAHEALDDRLSRSREWKRVHEALRAELRAPVEALRLLPTARSLLR